MPSRTKRKASVVYQPCQLESRAVRRRIDPGNEVNYGSSTVCPQCGERVKFAAAKRLHQIICNVYEAGVWQRTEFYHEACYVEAGKPYGSVDDSRSFRLTAQKQVAH